MVSIILEVIGRLWLEAHLKNKAFREAKGYDSSLWAFRLRLMEKAEREVRVYEDKADLDASDIDDLIAVIGPLTWRLILEEVIRRREDLMAELSMTERLLSLSAITIPRA